MEGMLGIGESKASFHHSLSSIGKSDEHGNTIAISYVGGTALRFIPLIVRLAILVALFFLPFYRQPFLFLPPLLPAPGWYTSLRTWEVFTLTTWLLGVMIYIVYFLFTLVVKNGLYRGVPGAEIHFTRYGKIVYTVRPGEKKFVIDPRVRPFAVVSTRIMTAAMPVVENNTRDNISLRFPGTLVFRVKDTLKLLQAGGFKSFFRQLVDLHTSLMKDEIQRENARHFNRFYVEPVQLPEGHAHTATVVDRLARLSSNTDSLSVEMLEELAEIDEINISQLGLEESSGPARKKIIPALQLLADTYGVEIIDHVPGGNLTSDDYLHTLALPLVSGILRLKQATDILRSISESVIDVDIQNQVASRQMLVLEIGKIVRSIKSVTKSIESEDSRKRLSESRTQTMRNTAHAILTTQLAQIEGLLARVKAGAVNLATADLLVRTMEKALAEIESTVETSLPNIDTVIVGKLEQSVITPDLHIVDTLLVESGLKKAIEGLERGQNADTIDSTGDFARELERVDVNRTIEAIEAALNEISTGTGMSTTQWTPEKVGELIENAEKKSASAALPGAGTPGPASVAV